MIGASDRDAVPVAPEEQPIISPKRKLGVLRDHVKRLMLGRSYGATKSLRHEYQVRACS